MKKKLNEIKYTDVCLFVLTDAQERQTDIATLRKEHPKFRDMTHVQAHFYCTSTPSLMLLRGGLEEVGKLRINKNTDKHPTSEWPSAQPLLTPHKLPLQTSCARVTYHWGLL